MLDDGRLTDGHGWTVNFSNTVIIMTSNLGAEHLLAGLSGVMSIHVAEERVMQDVRKHFRPELLNRLDEIVVFDPLKNEELRKVATLLMKDVAVQLTERGVSLAITDAALDLVLGEAYDPVYGARPLRRWLEKNVVTQLSRMLISGEIDENSAVNIDAVSGQSKLSYYVKRNVKLVNPTTELKADILNEVPANTFKSDVSQAVMKIRVEEIEDDEAIEETM